MNATMVQDGSVGVFSQEGDAGTRDRSQPTWQSADHAPVLPPGPLANRIRAMEGEGAGAAAAISPSLFPDIDTDDDDTDSDDIEDYITGSAALDPDAWDDPENPSGDTRVRHVGSPAKMPAPNAFIDHYRCSIGDGPHGPHTLDIYTARCSNPGCRAAGPPAHTEAAAFDVAEEWYAWKHYAGLFWCGVCAQNRDELAKIYQGMMQREKARKEVMFAGFLD